MTLLLLLTLCAGKAICEKHDLGLQCVAKLFSGVIMFVNFIWLIYGSTFIFSDINRTKDKCDESQWMFAYVMTILGRSSFASSLVCTFFFIRDTFIRDSAWIFVRN